MKNVAKIILYNDESVLLQLRDDDPSIPYPNHWSLLGGHVEEHETPEQAVQREIQQEIGVRLESLQHVASRKRSGEAVKDHIFSKEASLRTDNLTLMEGQAIKYLSRTEVDNHKVTPHYEPIIKAFLGGQDMPDAPNP